MSYIPNTFFKLSFTVNNYPVKLDLLKLLSNVLLYKLTKYFYLYLYL